MTEKQLNMILDDNTSSFKLNKETHVYFTEDLEENTTAYISVTQLLSQIGFAPDFSVIDREVVNKKAKLGTAVHEACEYLDNYNIDVKTHEQSPEYLNAYKELNLWTARSEYIVNYKDWIAGSIDKIIINPDETISIADIKCTAALNRKYVQWQTSLLAYMLEEQTGIEIESVYAIHIRKDQQKGCIVASKILLQRVPREIVKDLIHEFVDLKAQNLPVSDLGEKYAKKLGQTSLPAVAQLQHPYSFRELIENSSLDAAMFQLNKLVNGIQKLEDIKKQFLGELEEYMQRNEIDSIKFHGITATACPAIEFQQFDSKSFKTDYPDLYEDYCTMKSRAGYVKITKQKNKE